VEAEVTQALDGFLEGLAGGDSAPLERGEEFGVLSGGLAEGEIGVGGAGVTMDEAEELGFGAGEAPEDPFAIDDVVDEGAFLGAGRVQAGVVLGNEELVVGEVLGGEDGGVKERLGVGDAVAGAALFPTLGIMVGFIHGSSWCDWSTTGSGYSEAKILND
jgi:hypothetical protein